MAPKMSPKPAPSGSAVSPPAPTNGTSVPKHKLLITKIKAGFNKDGTQNEEKARTLIEGRVKKGPRGFRNANGGIKPGDAEMDGVERGPTAAMRNSPPMKNQNFEKEDFPMAKGKFMRKNRPANMQ